MICEILWTGCWYYIYPACSTDKRRSFFTFLSFFLALRIIQLVYSSIHVHLNIVVPLLRIVLDKLKLVLRQMSNDQVTGCDHVSRDQNLDLKVTIRSESLRSCRSLQPLEAPFSHELGQR